MAFINEQNLTTPLILQIQPFDTRFPFMLRWQFRGHLQPKRSEIRIMNLETGGEVAFINNPVMASEFTIHPSNWVNPQHGQQGPTYNWPQHIHARGNGHWYTVEVRVGFENGTWSPWSNRVQFLTLTRPNLQILSVSEDMEVHNHTVEFVATYSQAQNEPLRRFTFSLLDGNMRLIQQFPSQPAPGIWEEVPDSNPETDHLRGVGTNFLRLVQMVGRFDQNRGYVIRLEVETVNGMRWQQHQWFTSHYLEPTTEGVVNVAPIEEEGFIRITARLEQIRGSAASTMSESFPWKRLIDSEETIKQNAREEKKQLEIATRNLTEDNNIRFLPVGNPEWIVIPPDEKIIVRRVTFGAALVMHGQLVGGRCANGEIIMILQTHDEKETFTFYHYFADGRRRITCVKDNGSGHKAMYTSNSVVMPENHAWHLNMKMDWQRMSLRLHNQGQEVPV